VTVKDYIEQVDAQMAKGLLKSAGIECFLLGENTNSLLGAAFLRSYRCTRRMRLLRWRYLARRMTN
jgi:hypothetical protein